MFIELLRLLCACIYQYLALVVIMSCTAGMKLIRMRYKKPIATVHAADYSPSAVATASDEAANRSICKFYMHVASYMTSTVQLLCKLILL